MSKAVILTSLRVEYKAVRSYLQNLQTIKHPQGNIYEKGIFQGDEEQNTWNVMIAEIGPENDNAASQAERAISFFQPEIILFVGVAGGFKSKDVSLGDVVVANKVYGYESGKVEKGDFLTRPAVFAPDFKLLEIARFISRSDDWLHKIPGYSTEPCPKVSLGPIAAGNKVIASKKSELAQMILKHYNDTTAVEMEGKGFLQTAYINPSVGALLIRGISDLLDNKDKADGKGSQEVASKNAAAFAFEVLAFVDQKEKTDKPKDSLKQNIGQNENTRHSTMNSVKNILILSANPIGTSRIRIDEEVRKINDVLRGSKHRNQFKVQLKLAVRLQDLGEALQKYEPYIVYFTGHGSEEGLILEGEEGFASIIKEEAFGNLFKSYSDKIECVLLNAAFSEALAKGVSRHIPYTIGIKKALKDQTAIEFAGGFFSALGAGKSVEEAFAFGCNGIQLAIPDSTEHLSPTLYKKSMKNHEQDVSVPKVDAKNNSKFIEPHGQTFPVTRILVLSANPKTTPQLRIDVEVRELEEGLALSKRSNQFELWSELAVRTSDIHRTLLEYEPHIVHFIGHGSVEGLMVEDVLGFAIRISADALSDLFKLFSDKIKCVILSACYSESQAKAIIKHIDYVIGMRKEIRDKACIEFAVGFYDALGAGKSIEDAFKFGCNAIQILYPESSEHLIPILLKRKGLGKNEDRENMDIARKPLSDFTIEELEQELISRGAQVPEGELLKISEGGEIPTQDFLMAQVKEHSDSAISLPPNEALGHIDTQEIVEMLEFKTKSIDKSDNRMDYYAIQDEQIKINTGCVALICKKDILVNVGEGLSSLKVQNFGKTFNLHEFEPFRNQPVAAGRVATGFLVEENLLATAAHIVTEGDLKDLCFVFGFKMLELSIPSNEIPNENIYKGEKIIHRVYNRNSGEDWALVRLDRTVVGQSIAHLSRNDISPDQPVYVLGYHCGLPLKYAPGARIREVGDTYFSSDLNVYNGNSGSPVFDSKTHEVVGMVVRGYNQDFRWTENGWISIARSNIKTNSAIPGCTRVSTFIDYVYTEGETSGDDLDDSISESLFVELELRTAISTGSYLDGKQHFKAMEKKSLAWFPQIKEEFGFIYNYDEPEKDENHWKQKEGQIWWWRKIWQIMSIRNDSDLGKFKILEEQEETPELLEDTSDKKDKQKKPGKKDDKDKKTSEAKGEALEQAAFKLFQQLFIVHEHGDAVDMINERQQDRGLQFGYDLKFVVCETQKNKTIRILAECKDYSKKIKLNDIAGKLAATKSYFKGIPIDHWILISPNSNVSSELDMLLEHWEEAEEYPFKVQVWTPATGVKEFFGLIPELYNEIITEHDLDLHPKNWNEEKRKKVIDSCKRKLAPPLRLPQGWGDYLRSPAKLMLEPKEAEFEERYISNDYVDMNCIDEAGAIFPQTLEKKIIQWLEEPIKQSPTTLLLGEFGDGKTCFTYILTRKLTEKFLQSPKDSWLPVRFALKNLESDSVQGIQYFLEYRLKNFRADVAGWNELRSSGFKLLAILDGFDEISKALDPETIQKNIHRLINCYKSEYFSDMKLLITSRKHFFENFEEKEWLIDKLDDPQLLHLAPIDRQTTHDHLKNYAIEIGEEDKFNKLIGCHDPIGMASKPLFLDMTQVALKKLSVEDVNEYNLYEAYVQECLERKEEYLDDELSKTKKADIKKNLLKVMEVVALKLNQINQEYVYLSDIQAKEDLKKLLWDLTDPDNKAKKDEIARAASRSLLKRAETNDQQKEKKWPVHFCHRSMREYFVGRAVCSMVGKNLEEAEAFLTSCFLSFEILFFASKIMRKKEKFDYTPRLLALIGKTRNVKDIDKPKLGYLGCNAVNLLYQYKGNLPESKVFDWRNLVLDHAILPDADLSRKDFSNTSFRSANLDNVDFTDANFSCCDFTNVRIEETTAVQSIAITPGEKILALYQDGIIREWDYHKPGRPISTTLSSSTKEKGFKLITQPGNDLTILHDRYLFFCDRQGTNLEQKAAIEMNPNFKLLKASRDFLLLHENSEKQKRIVLVDLKEDALAASLYQPTFFLCDHLDRHAFLLYNEKEELLLIDTRKGGNGSQSIPNDTKISCIAVQKCSGADDVYMLGLGLYNGAVELWVVDVPQWKCQKVLAHPLHQEEKPVKDICFIDENRIVTGGLDKTIKMLSFNRGGEVTGEPLEFKMSLRCRGMKIEGMIREKIEQEKLRGLIEKAEEPTPGGLSRKNC